MAWRVHPRLRPPAAFLPRRHALPGRPAPHTSGTCPLPPPLSLRHDGGCLVIGVERAVGPGHEPTLGRLLHAAIRSGGSVVLVDLRRAPALSGSALSVLHLARSLADRHGLPMVFLREVAPPQAVPAAPAPPEAPAATRLPAIPAPVRPAAARPSVPLVPERDRDAPAPERAC
ncbi:hypothetical protein [Streptomyces minutiscleroticus]|uniref:STAS domain-containing protein n=1 Tax=Streptomyces minutiscleroticus TaxID=68238 RepID=A0A918NRS3_9ACTN|nr:hypothetical protein [Streptomyces minutiscleroticus]GGX90595.1 hypothetical protein GCM10010358_50740 [Streptomyces minutiscleroticus]